MKLTIKEAKPNPAESERPYEHAVLFQGEVDCCQFRCHDVKIATPDFILPHDNEVIIIYSYPCNIRPEIEGDTYKTLWLESAIDPDELRKAIAQRVETEATRQQNLKVLTEEGK